MSRKLKEVAIINLAVYSYYDVMNPPPSGHQSIALLTAPNPPPPPPPTAFQCLIAGSISGSLSTLFCHPIDVIRTRMQLRARVVVNHGGEGKVGGVRGGFFSRFISLYRGISGPFFAQALYKSVIFASNKVIGSAILMVDGGEQPTYFKTFLAAFLSGSLNSFIVAPVELIRTRQIVSSHGSLLRCIREVYLQKHSLLSFWAVLPPTVARDGVGVGLYLLTFEFFKNKFNKNNNNNNDSSINKDNDNFLNYQPSPFITRLISGSLAGVAFWFWALPIDTLKTNIEASLNSSNGSNATSTSASSSSSSSGSSSSSNSAFGRYFNAVKTSLREGKVYPSDASFMKKVSFFYRAWPAALFRGIPAAAITLTTFDYMIDVLTKQR